MKINIYDFRNMKRVLVLFLFSSLLFSCGNSEERSVEEIIETNDLQEIKAKKVELSKQQSSLNSRIDRLDEAINLLDPDRNIPLVTTSIVQDTTFKHFTEVQGDVATKENILVYPEFSGLLTDVYVEEGQRVNKGAVLAKIDDGGLSSQLAQLEAQAALAKTTFDRQKRLWDQEIGSEIQYLEAQTNYEATLNSVNQLKAQLEKTIVKAPFTGVIDQVITEEGVVVNPGQNPLFRLVNLQNMYVEADVPENYLGQIKKGSSVIVEIGAIGQEFEGEVRQVGNFIDPNNRTFEIQVALPNSDGLIKPNLIATVLINDYTAENAIVIPENTVQQNSQGQNLVFVLESQEDSTGIAQRTFVETGYSYGDSVEITEGLQPGDVIVIEGGRNLRDQQKVIIKN